MQSKAATVDAYLQELPEDRREAISTLHNFILKKLPKGYEATMLYGMITYVVPLDLYPKGYHTKKGSPLPYISLASQKNYMSLYLMHIYMDKEDEQWFKESWEASGKKLDAGKCCVRFKKLDDVPLGVVGKAVKLSPVKKFIKQYESVIKR